MLEDILEIGIGCLVVLVVVAFTIAIMFGFYWVITALIVWAAAGFGYTLPFWPTFVIIILLNLFLGSRSN